MTMTMMMMMSMCHNYYLLHVQSYNNNDDDHGSYVLLRLHYYAPIHLSRVITTTIMVAMSFYTYTYTPIHLSSVT